MTVRDLYSGYGMRLTACGFCARGRLAILKMMRENPNNTQKEFAKRIEKSSKRTRLVAGSSCVD